MKRFLKYIFFVLILLAIATYTQRSRIFDLVIKWQKPEVEEVGYEEGTEGTEALENSEGASVIAPRVNEEAEEPAAETDTNTDSQLPITNNQLPIQYNLAIPFTSQAPLGVWDTVHQETCEEAATLMVAAYYAKQSSGTLDADTVEEELQRITKFEDVFFGYNQDTTASETALVIENYENLSTELIMNPTVEQMKEALVAGYPIIVPAAGRLLDNPYFTAPGPLYHMLVVKGYTEDGFITNDPGTRHGADYPYPFATLLSANHDWNGGDVALGEQVIIIVKP